MDISYVHINICYDKLANSVFIATQIAQHAWLMLFT